MRMTIKVERKLNIKKNIRMKKDYFIAFYFILSLFFCVGVKTPSCLFVIQLLKKIIHLLVNLYFLLSDLLLSIHSIPGTYLSCFLETGNFRTHFRSA